MLKCILFSPVFLHNVLHNLGTGLMLAVVDHEVVLEIVQATLSLLVIYRRCEDPTSEHNSNDPLVSQSVVTVQFWPSLRRQCG